MARPKGGAYTKEKSQPLAFRLPNELVDAAVARAGGKENLNAWAREVIRRELAGKPQGLSEAQLMGYEEGKRQGWAHANKAFREALGEAVKKLK
jgi:hypothetical protein